MFFSASQSPISLATTPSTYQRRGLLVLLDLMPECGGFYAIENILSLSPSATIIEAADIRKDCQSQDQCVFYRLANVDNIIQS